MTYTTRLQGAVCCAALIAGGAAQADVTAAQVWEDWQALSAVYGEDAISFSAEDLSGDTLIVRDVTMTVDTPEVDVVAEVGDITFAGQGNGTVLVTMVESYPVTVSLPGGPEITLILSQSGLEMLFSGEPGDMTYDITADSTKLALQDVVDGDDTFTGDVYLEFSDLASTYNVQTGDLIEVTYDGTVGSFDLLVDFEVPGQTGEYVTIGGKTENMAFGGAVTMPPDVDFENPDVMFTDGFATQSRYTIENSAYVFDINVDRDQMSGSFSAGATTLDSEVSKDKLAYAASSDDVAVNVTSSAFPFPIEVGLAQYGIGLEMPLAKSDEPSDFGFNIDLVDVTINDMIWNLFDPGSVLPRDAATIQVALSGLAKPLIDLMDPANEDALFRSEMPIELVSVALDRLRISAAGAVVTGEGEFTFDNTDMQSFAPLPKPEGDVIVEISGLNALLDNLVSMGLLPEEQAMAPRMMMGVFARSTGDDQIETKLEVTADGEVLANGQRLH